MLQMSLTDFVDIVSKSGRPKATKVRQVIDRPEYEPAFDFYKPLRDHITDTHRRQANKNSLGDILTGLTDPKKQKAYPDLVNGYKRWWGRKALEWFNPPRGSYAASGIEIIINPEIGVSINGDRHVIKLYFKSEPLTSTRTELIRDLMEHTLRTDVQPTDIFAVLDVRNSKFVIASSKPATSIHMVNAEMAYIASIWGADPISG